MDKAELIKLRESNIYALADLLPAEKTWGMELFPADLHDIIMPLLDHIDALEQEIAMLQNAEAPDSISVAFMHDGHSFTQLKGKTLDEILAHADAIESGEDGSYGSLCPAILLRGKREIRRIGPMVHAKGSRDSKDQWNEGKAEWMAALSADPDVQRILAMIAAAPEPQS